jgi:hypothetical protein
VDFYSLDLYAENFWDFNFYIGILGFSFILYFGLFLWIQNSSPLYRELVVPVLVITALSIGSTYWIIRFTGIPLFASERAVMRMISVPVVWLFLIGSIMFQEWWNKHKLEVVHQAAALLGLALLFIDLWSNMRIWRPSEIKQFFVPVPMNIAGNAVANHPDSPYILILSIGLGITLLTAVFLLFMSWRETKKGSTTHA